MADYYIRPSIKVSAEPDYSADEAEIYVDSEGNTLGNNMTDEEILQEFEEDHGYKARSIQEARAYNKILLAGHKISAGVYGLWK